MGRIALNIFVTVGTTPFDRLIEEVDTGEFANNSFMQIADGNYIPQHAEWCRYAEDVSSAINDADVVVCHAGAGSVFKLLESGIKPIVVPNTDRRDKHQLELANWLEFKNYAVVAFTSNAVNETLDSYHIKMKKCVKFVEPRFFYGDEINSLIKERVKT